AMMCSLPSPVSARTMSADIAPAIIRHGSAGDLPPGPLPEMEGRGSPAYWRNRRESARLAALHRVRWQRSLRSRIVSADEGESSGTRTGLDHGGEGTNDAGP